MTALGEVRADDLPVGFPIAGNPPRMPALARLHLSTVRHARQMRSIPPPAPVVPQRPPPSFLARYLHPLALGGLLVALGVQWRYFNGDIPAQAPLDKYAHFVFPAAAGPMIYAALFGGVGARPSAHASLFLMLVLGVFCAVAWEVVEFALIDYLMVWGWQVDNTDTMIDLINGAAGATVGGILYLYLNRC